MSQIQVNKAVSLMITLSSPASCIISGEVD